MRGGATEVNETQKWATSTGLTDVLSRYLPVGAEENHEKPHSR
jgi:hypothetical protein